MSRKCQKHRDRIESDLTSQNQFWYKMCLRKAVFWTESSAKLKAKKFTEKGHPRRAYQCPNCYQWHLTSQMKIGEVTAA